MQRSLGDRREVRCASAVLLSRERCGATLCSCIEGERMPVGDTPCHPGRDAKQNRGKHDPERTATCVALVWSHTITAGWQVSTSDALPLGGFGGL